MDVESQAEKMVYVGAYAPTHTIFSDSLRFLAAQAHCSLNSYYKTHDRLGA